MYTNLNANVAYGSKPNQNVRTANITDRNRAPINTKFPSLNNQTEMGFSAKWNNRARFNRISGMKWRTNSTTETRDKL